MAKKKEPTCPECGYKYFVDDKSRGEKICAKCGLVLEESIVDVSQEWRAFDEEQRSRRARTGAPLTFSVDYQEPIIIKDGDEVKVVKIGEFADKIIEENKDKVVRQGILEVVFLENSVQTVSFDTDYKVGFHDITEVSRHPVDFIYELDVEGGKKIKVTGAHSIFTVKNNEVVPIKVDEIKQKDFIVAPKTIPSPDINPEINLLEKFRALSKGGKNVYLRNISDENILRKAMEVSKKFGIHRKQESRWLEDKAVPLFILNKFWDSNFKLNGERIGIFYKNKPELPLNFKITPEFCRMLGFYVAEGSSDGYSLRFSFGSHETDYINEVAEITKSLFDITPTVHRIKDYSLELEINSKLLSILFLNILEIGNGAHNKRVPPIVFSLPSNLKSAFLNGYLAGDGHLWRREGTRDTQIGAISCSKNLMTDLLHLYLQLGVHANYVSALIPSHKIEKTGQILPDSIVHMVRVTNPDVAVKLGFIDGIRKRKRKNVIEELIPSPLMYKKEWKSRKRIRISRDLAIKISEKYKDKQLLKLATAPLIFLRVKSISKVKPTHKYAYDLAVPGCENFVCSTLFAKNTKHDKGMTTEIGKGPGELYKVSSAKRAQYYRLSKWQKRLVESKDRNLSFALSELQRLISFLGLPRGVHEGVAKKYEQAVDWGLVRGRSMESVIAALLYAVCREFGTPRTLEEIAEASGVDRREIGRTYRYIARELNIRILPASPEHFVPRFASMLGLSDQVQARAIQILKKAKKDQVTSGKGPTGVAAAALYIAAVLQGEKKTQREIADAVGVTEVTIRNRFKEVVDKLGITEEVEKMVREVVE